MLDDTKDPKAMETKVERYEIASDSETGIVKPVEESGAMGTVTMTDLNEIFLIPSPSADPRGAQFATCRWSWNVLTVAVRSVELNEVSQDPVRRSSLDILGAWPRAGLWLWWSSEFLHPRLCSERCHICRYHRFDDISVNVHGCWQPGLHASSACGGKATRLSPVAADPDRFCGVRCLRKRLQSAPWC